jgi:hypothetical protein
MLSVSMSTEPRAVATVIVKHRPRRRCRIPRRPHPDLDSLFRRYDPGLREMNGNDNPAQDCQEVESHSRSQNRH